MGLKVIIFGATGMVGEGALHEALHDAQVSSVLVIGRRPCGVVHPKLTEVIHADFLDYRPIEARLAGYDACFFCLGVTSIGMSEEAYRRVTYMIPMAAAATLLRLNPGMVFCHISGAGSDSSEHGRVMWARVKGKAENDLLKLPFRAVYILRPGFIRPTPGLKRASGISRATAPFYPLLRVLAPRWVCTLEEVGRAMIRAAAQGDAKRVLECGDIAALGRGTA